VKFLLEVCFTSILVPKIFIQTFQVMVKKLCVKKTRKLSYKYFRATLIERSGWPNFFVYALSTSLLTYIPKLKGIQAHDFDLQAFEISFPHLDNVQNFKNPISNVVCKSKSCTHIRVVQDLNCCRGNVLNFNVEWRFSCLRSQLY